MKVNIALLTVTDSRTLKTDKSGAILVNKINKAKHNLVDRKICKDNKKDIKKILKKWLKKKKIDVIITTGGTGLTGRGSITLHKFALKPNGILNFLNSLDVFSIISRETHAAITPNHLLFLYLFTTSVIVSLDGSFPFFLI